MTTIPLLFDAQWAVLEPLLPPEKGAMGKPMRPHRPVVEGAIYRLKFGVPWRQVPEQFGAWQMRRCRPTPTAVGSWTGQCRSTRRSRGCTSTVRMLQGRRWGRRPTQGARSNDTDQPARQDEPDDHAIGRSRGGLTTKIHALVDGKGRALVLIVSPGQAGDSLALPRLLAELRVARCGPGRPRTTPVRLRGDKVYSSRGHRALLRSRGPLR